MQEKLQVNRSPMKEDGGVILYLQTTIMQSIVCSIRHSLAWFRPSFVACGSDEGDNVAVVHATIDVLYLLHGIAVGNDVRRRRRLPPQAMSPASSKTL
jgi:hypothetical protein